MPQVSVIIPLYNKGNYIGRALDSVFAQTFQDYEVIVVNDGSTDDGPAIAAGYKDARLRIIEQENAGPGAARNRGIREARGQYIAFLDADDEWLPEFLKKSYQALEANPDCGVCVSGWYQDKAVGSKIFRNENIINVYKSLGINLSEGRIDANFLAYDKYILYLWWTSTVFVRKNILQNKYCFYDKTKHTYGEDHYLWLQLAFNHPFYQNLSPLAWYHNCDSSLATGGYREKPLEAFMLWPEELVHKTKPENKKKLHAWLANYALKSAHNRLGVGQYNNAVFLMKKFPAMKSTLPVSYLKLYLKMLLSRAGIYQKCQK
jgi:glycosyltransferase involved in cell wall biosynthesis